MRFVSPLLKNVVYPCLANAGYFRAISRPGLAVITYHGVLPQDCGPANPDLHGNLVTAETFRRQLRLLKKKYTIISPEEMRLWVQGGHDLPRRAALLTCDDGFVNNLTEMVPILRDEGLGCLFFVTGASASGQHAMLWYEKLLLLFLRAREGAFKVASEEIEISGFLGERQPRRKIWWDAVKRLSQYDASVRDAFMSAAHAYFDLPDSVEFYSKNYPESRLLTCSELQQMAAGGMTIGAHTLTHPILTQLPAELAWNEIVESRARLESALGKPIWAFAYPFGDSASVSPRIISMAKQAGFDAAFLNIGGGLGASLPAHAIPRVHVNASMSLAEFEAHVSGFYESLQRGLRRTPQVGVPAFEGLRTEPAANLRHA